MENNFKVNMNEYLPLRDVVFNTLRQAILKGELAPGERLMEIQLAEKLGVSRTPIREAIRKLELEGLVLMIPRKGAEVAKISEKSLRDVLEVRRSLEELAIELACQRMSEDDMAELERMQGNFKSAIDRGEAMSIAQSDEQYHDVIYQGTRNDKLVQMLGNLREQMYRYRLEYIKDEDKRQVLLVEHEHILNALKNRNIAEAKKAGIPVISSMGTGNKLNPTMLEVSDISKTSVCPLAKVMRYELKKRGIKGVKVVYSKEEPIKPAFEAADGGAKRAVPGSISFVPSAAGLIIASEVIKDLIGGKAI